MKKSFFTLCLFLMSILLTKNSFAIGFTVSTHNPCLGSTFTVVDTSSPPPGLSIAYRTWNFGPSVTFKTTSNTMDYVYNQKGSFTVTLKLTYSDNSTQGYSFPDIINAVTPPTNSFKIKDTNITCPGVSIRFEPFFTPGDGVITNYTFIYGDGNFANNANTITSYSYQNLGTFKVQYIVKDNNECSDTAYNTIRIINTPQISFVALDPSCRDSIVYYENTTVNKSQFSSWTWTFTDTLNSTYQSNDVNTNYTWKHMGSYTVQLEGTNVFKCKAVYTQNYTIDTTPIVRIYPNNDTIICFGQSVKFTFRGSDTIYMKDFLWGEKIKDDTVVLFTPKNTKTWYVYGKTKNCNEAGYPFKISVVQPISSNIKATPTDILVGTQSKLIFTSNGIYDSVKWTPTQYVACSKCDSTFVSPLTSTTYNIQVFYSLDTYKCSLKDSIKVNVYQVCSSDSIHIPNAFTPNGDNHNDIFYVKSYSLATVQSLKVYNRWGNEVYSNTQFAPNDLTLGWNGKEFNTGEDLESGMYIYHIVVTCKNNQTLTFQGEINLLR